MVWRGKIFRVAEYIPNDRKLAPVFVMGCHRSGTNLLYDMLLSSGGFAIHRGYLPLYKILIPRFGSMKSRRNRQKILDTWLRSKGFRRSGLDVEPLSTRILGECRTGGDFIRVVMESVAASQHADRWAVYDPDNVLHIERVKRDLPDALFVHIIRDGRDIALSLKKMGGFSALPWDRGPTESLVATALYWEWMVQKGREDGRKLGADYTEVRFEELISNPPAVLSRLAKFIEQELDYDHILKVGIGSVSQPNTSFKDSSNGAFNPLGRWKQGFTSEQLAMFEALVGNTLEQLGYELGTPDRALLRRPDSRRMRAAYRAYFDSKLWLKAKTPLGKVFVTKDLSWL